MQRPAAALTSFCPLPQLPFQRTKVLAAPFSPEYKNNNNNNATKYSPIIWLIIFLF